jgi:hypothetical protein
MEFITLQDLRLSSDEIRRKLREQKQLILTVRGRPIAIVAGIEGDQLEETLAALRQAHAQLAVTRMRQVAQRQGLDRMTEEEIEAEIAAARQERYQRDEKAVSC